MQDVGRGTHKLRRRALHLPPPVPRRPHGAAGRRGRLRGADGDRHPGDPRPGDRPRASASRVLIFTNLLLLPVLLSYIGVSPAAAQRSLREEREETARRGARQALWLLLDRFTERRWAIGAVVGAAVLARRRLRGEHCSCRSATSIPGAPELRADSRYNRDNAYITAPLRAVERPVRGDREDAARTAATSTRRWSRPTASAGRCGRCPACRRRSSLADVGAPDHRRLVRGQPEVADARRATRTCSTTPAQQASVNNPDLVQPELLGDAGDRLPGRPQGRDARPRASTAREDFAARARRARTRSSCSPPAAPASRRRPTSSCARRGRTMLLYVYARGDRCCASSPSAAGARWSSRWCRW